MPPDNEQKTPDKTETDKKLEPAPTPEEIAQGAKAFMAKMGFDVVDEAPEPAPEAKPEEKPEEPPAPAAEVKPEEKPAAAKPEEKPKEEVKPKGDRIEFDKAPEPDLAEQAAAKAVEKISDRLPQPAPKEEPKPAPATEAPTLTPKQERTLAVIKEMQESDPDYRAVPLVQQTMQFWEKEAAYRANWQKENPGQNFNPRGPEHNEFYEAMPEYTDDAFELARARLEEKRIKEVEDRLGSKVQELEQKHIITQELPKIRARVAQDLAVLAAQSDPEIEKLVVKDGRPQLTREVVEEMKKKDPLAHRLLSVESTRAQAVIEEAERMYSIPGFKFDANLAVKLPNGEVVHPHQEIDQFMGELEQDLVSRPPSATMRGGKRFMRQDDYVEHHEQIVRSSRNREEAQRRLKTELIDKVWTVDARFFAQAYVDHASEKVKTQLAEWRGYVKPQTEPEAKPAPEAKPPAEETKPTSKKPSPPNLTAGSDKTNSTAGGQPGLAERDAAIEKRMWGM